MRIVFITDQPVPIGMATTNRLLSLATGINESGCDANILIINPTEKIGEVKNTKTHGYYKDVKYKYLTSTQILPVNIIKKSLVYLNGLFRLLKELRLLHRTSPIDAIIILHTWSIYPLSIYFLFIRKSKVIYLHERSEYPFINQNINIFRKMDYFLYTKCVLKRFDGLMVISKHLVSYYSQFLQKKALITVIPMTVEPDRFGHSKKDRNEKYVAYCGYLGGNKDGVYDLIKAFALISKEFPDYFLYIIGDSKNSEEFNFLKNLAKEKGVENKVIFTGRISSYEIPAFLDNAEVLALSRPQSVQAEGGFPTKLGEYLATGNPVVVTRVGNIPDYLIDNVNAYLANPDDIEDFAEKLKMALINKEQSKIIGALGKELTESVFNYQVQGKRIIEFVNEIKRKRSK